MGGILYRIAIAFRGAIPLALGLLLTAFTFVPFGAPELSVILPSLTMPLVFFWSINRRQVMPPAVAFLIGLWQDILVGGPLGLMALILVLMRGAVETQRQVFRNQSAVFIWMGFAIISVGLTLIAWVIACWWYWNGFSLLPFMLQWGLGVIAYVPMVMLFGRVEHLLFDRQERS
jgi:rod shape-determining protein MreD